MSFSKIPDLFIFNPVKLKFMICAPTENYKEFYLVREEAWIELYVLPD
ncbi:hypothetical protein QSE00_14670 [Arenibacter sp. M-2]|nr:hypothetical protein [Arenibacter sp. M-2]|tara:strand:- start:1153 stop:1296 length:144 start_codon:yes stop_codon:yes gene_type:complete